ncbi:MAG: hypothetical protein U0R79_08115 [Propionicimonas sp.]
MSEYQRYLDRLIYPTLGEMRLKDVTPATVRAWIGKLNPKTSLNEHAYALLKTIFATAVQTSCSTEPLPADAEAGPAHRGAGDPGRAGASGGRDAPSGCA